MGTTFDFSPLLPLERRQNTAARLAGAGSASWRMSSWSASGRLSM